MFLHFKTQQKRTILNVLHGQNPNCGVGWRLSDALVTYYTTGA